MKIITHVLSLLHDTDILKDSTENQNPTDKTVQVVIAKTTKIQQASKICSALTQTCTSSLFLLHTCSCSDHMADDSG